MIIPDKITVNAMYVHTFDEKGNVNSSSGTHTDDIVYTSGYEDTKDFPYFQNGNIQPQTNGNRNSKRQIELRQMVIDQEKLKESMKQLEHSSKTGERTNFLTYRYYLSLPYQNKVKVIDEQNYYSDFWAVIAWDINIWERCSATLAFVWVSCLIAFIIVASTLSNQTYKTYQERE